MPKRALIEFVPSRENAGVALKFGGEPFGLPSELWPASKSSGRAMQFICQIPFGPELFPGTSDTVAYLFMSAGDAEGTWLPDGGENAVVLVPRAKLTNSTTVGEAPRLTRMVKKWWRSQLSPEPCVHEARLVPSEEPPFLSWSERTTLSEDEAGEYHEALMPNKLGGSPMFLQEDEFPIPEPWHLLLQLDSAEVPFSINFGDAGIGYAFINQSGTEGKFLWQCC